MSETSASKQQRVSLTQAIWMALIITTVLLSFYEGDNLFLPFLELRPILLPLAVLDLVLTMQIGKRLYRLSPKIFGFGITRLLKQAQYKRRLAQGLPVEPPEAGYENESTNFQLSGINIRYLGVIMLIAVGLFIPKVVLLEELFFRDGITSWWDALYLSILFGAVHMLFGVSLATGLTIMLGGLFYSYLYFLGGNSIDLPYQVHLQYDLIIIVWLLIGATVRSVLGMNSDEPFRFTVYIPMPKVFRDYFEKNQEK